MKRLLVLTVAVLAAACDDSPTGYEEATPPPSMSVIGADPLVGAIVLNLGEASGDFFGTCRFLGRTTTDVVMVRTPNGGGLIRCQWDVWPTTSEFDRAQIGNGFNCSLSFFGFSLTTRSQFVLATNGTANMSCTFPSIPTPPTAECYGAITSGIASTWPWAHDGQSAFPPPLGSLAQWVETFGPLIGFSSVRDLQLFFCGV